VTKYANPVDRVLAGQTARTPILVGSMQDDGTVFTTNSTGISAFVASIGTAANTTLTPATLRALYPDRTDLEVIADAERDNGIKW
jgi:hypothetical protein